MQEKHELLNILLGNRVQNAGYINIVKWIQVHSQNEHVYFGADNEMHEVFSGPPGAVKTQLNLQLTVSRIVYFFKLGPKLRALWIVIK